MRLPNGDDQRAFCKVDGWNSIRSTDHAVYSKVLLDGTILTTLVSHGNKQIRNPDLLAHICRDELRCSPADFWDAVDHGRPVPRPQPAPPEPKDPIPLGLIRALRAQGHSQDEIRRLTTKAEALQLLRGDR